MREGRWGEIESKTSPMPNHSGQITSLQANKNLFSSILYRDWCVRTCVRERESASKISPSITVTNNCFATKLLGGLILISFDLSGSAA